MVAVVGNDGQAAEVACCPVASAMRLKGLLPTYTYLSAFSSLFSQILSWDCSVLPLPAVLPANMIQKFPLVLTWSDSIEENKEEDQDNTEVVQPEELMLKVKKKRYQAVRYTTEEQNSLFSATDLSFCTWTRKGAGAGWAARRLLPRYLQWQGHGEEC